MDNNEELVVIREYDSITRAETAKSLLESEGIFATIRNEYMSAIYPVGTMPAQIVVRRWDAEWAAALLPLDGRRRRQITPFHTPRRSACASSMGRPLSVRAPLPPRNKNCVTVRDYRRQDRTGNARRQISAS